MSGVGLGVSTHVQIPEELHSITVENCGFTILTPAQKLIFLLVRDLGEELGVACHWEHQALCYDASESLVSGLDCQACSLFPCRVSSEPPEQQ